MHRPFDVRKRTDREALAELLPTIDMHTFVIDKETFIDALEAVGQYLNNPEWLVYRWGAFYPIPCGAFNSSLSIGQLVDFGLYIRSASRFRNFDNVLKGFSNPTQFLDSLFEIKIAHLFSNLHSFIDLQFEPKYNVRNRIKRPEFEIMTTNGQYCVECKRPHMHAQMAIKSLQAVGKEIYEKMVELNWPTDFRLEVELVGPKSAPISDLASRVVEAALKNGEKHEPFFLSPFKVFVVKRSDPFRLPSAPWHTDTMILGNTPTGLLNPTFTSLRVADYRLDSKFETSIGGRVREALKQLPEDQNCIIAIGDTSPRIAVPICKKRINDKAYSHIKLFVISVNNDRTLVFRDEDFSAIKEIFKDIKNN